VSPSDERTARNVYLVLAIAFGVMAAFWIFYSIRLLTVTRGLQGIRPGGQGAYVGAVVFPALALVCGWLSVRWFRRVRRLGRSQPPLA
jgi:hypothetical protein